MSSSKTLFKNYQKLRKRIEAWADYKGSWKDKDSAERNLQKIIEALIDVGKMVIAEKRLKEPGNNREVFLILEDYKIFPSEFMPLVDKMIGLRNVIVHGYNKINDEIIYGILKKNLKEVRQLTKTLKAVLPDQRVRGKNEQAKGLRLKGR